MTNTLIIRQSQILLPDGTLQVGDVFVSGRTIAAVAIGTASPQETQLNQTADLEIDGQGYTLLPGVIDPQVHFREPGLEHKEDLFTASCACAKGGVTSFLEMPNTKPLTITQATLDDKLQRAASKSLVNYGFLLGQQRPICPI